MISIQHYRLDKQGGFIFRNFKRNTPLPGLRRDVVGVRLPYAEAHRQRRTKDKACNQAAALCGVRADTSRAARLYRAVQAALR